jgi:hypothetical protein
MTTRKGGEPGTVRAPAGAAHTSPARATKRAARPYRPGMETRLGRGIECWGFSRIRDASRSVYR